MELVIGIATIVTLGVVSEGLKGTVEEVIKAGKADFSISRLVHEKKRGVDKYNIFYIIDKVVRMTVYAYKKKGVNRNNEN